MNVSNSGARGQWSESALDRVRSEFVRLAEQAVVLPPTAVGALPEPATSWGRLRELLLDPALPLPVIDAVWAELVRRARAGGDEATLVCAGMALPMLATVAGRLSAAWRDDRRDIAAAVLTGFLAELVRIDTDRPSVLWRLRWAAYRAGAEWIEQAKAAPTPDRDIGARDPHRALEPVTHAGHPELVLAEAITEGVITAAAAELIAVTRLQKRPLSLVAAERQIPYKRMHQTRHRAELKLATWLAERTRDLDPTRASEVERRALHAVALTIRTGASAGRVSGSVSNIGGVSGVPSRGPLASNARIHPVLAEEDSECA